MINLPFNTSSVERENQQSKGSRVREEKQTLSFTETRSVGDSNRRTKKHLDRRFTNFYSHNFPILWEGYYKNKISLSLKWIFLLIYCLKSVLGPLFPSINTSTPEDQEDFSCRYKQIYTSTGAEKSIKKWSV